MKIIFVRHWQTQLNAEFTKIGGASPSEHLNETWKQQSQNPWKYLEKKLIEMKFGFVVHLLELNKLWKIFLNECEKNMILS